MVLCNKNSKWGNILNSIKTTSLSKFNSNSGNLIFSPTKYLYNSYGIRIVKMPIFNSTGIGTSSSNYGNGFAVNSLWTGITSSLTPTAVGISSS